jgi:type VI protein secretion system component Hcp
MKKSLCRKILMQLAVIVFIGLPFQSYAAVQVIACFESYNEQLLVAESQVAISNANALIGNTKQDCVTVNSISYDFMQTLNIGSQSAGAGAGKINFNPLTIYKNLDALSSALFLNMANGSPFKSVNVFFRQSTPTLGQSGTDIHTKQQYSTVVMVQFGLVAIKTIRVTAKTGESSLSNNEEVVLEYGGIKMSIFNPSANGTAALMTTSGWDMVNNVASANPEGIPDLTPQ